jgi:type 1 fimbria pilin
MNMLKAIVHALRARSRLAHSSTRSPATHSHVTGGNPRTRRWAWLGALVLGGVLLHSGNAHATDPGTCAFATTPPFPEAGSRVSLQTPLSGSFTIGRDLPVGSIIYQRIIPTSGANSVFCSPAGLYSAVLSYTSTPYPLASYTSPTYGNVYQTSVPGIGAVITAGAAGTALPATLATYNFTAGGYATPLGTSGQTTLYLIKTGPVSPGTLTGSGLPVTHQTEGTNSLEALVSSFIGAINIVAGTCVTPNVTVNLGTHTLSELTGVGTSTGLVNVPIQLNNCPAFYGQSQVVINGGAALPVTANTLSFQVNPTTSVVNASQGVMALTSTGSGAATGMGIQMLNASNAPIQYGTATPSGLALSKVDGASYTINLQARYYQTAATTTAGQANGSATVTLIYN